MIGNEFRRMTEGLNRKFTEVQREVHSLADRASSFQRKIEELSREYSNLEKQFLTLVGGKPDYEAKSALDQAKKQIIVVSSLVKALSDSHRNVDMSDDNFLRSMNILSRKIK